VIAMSRQGDRACSQLGGRCLLRGGQPESHDRTTL
jgi:hypothetical protein